MIEEEKKFNMVPPSGMHIARRGGIREFETDEIFGTVGFSSDINHTPIGDLSITGINYSIPSEFSIPTDLFNEHIKYSLILGREKIAFRDSYDLLDPNNFLINLRLDKAPREQRVKGRLKIPHYEIELVGDSWPGGSSSEEKHMSIAIHSWTCHMSGTKFEKVGLFIARDLVDEIADFEFWLESK